ncbi:MAG: Uncharacterized protein Athens101426_593 [Parcubacteria group bacterium Athens1014_26]|nr:MAG: Uncharacterized protein Athens101426_593 [Parcubacteria group bacterium Athens1014_26]
MFFILYLFVDSRIFVVWYYLHSMQFQVPQFIETEDKIIGPLTLKQFLYIGAGAGLIFIAFYLFNTFLWLIFSVFVASLAAALAFIRINGRPLPSVLMAAIYFYWKPRLFLWKRTETRKTPEFKIPSIEEKPSSLKNLWQQLITTKNPLPKREKILKPSILSQIRASKEQFEMVKKITGERDMTRRVDYR